MHRTHIKTALIVGFLALFLQPSSVSAQFKGFLNLGVTGSSFRGGNLNDASAIYRFGGGGGVRYVYPSGFEIETGLNYVVKGAGLKGTLDEIPIIGTSEITYVEIPLLLGYRFNAQGKTSPRLYAGPSMAFKTDAKITFHAPGSDFEQSETDDSVESQDLGLAVGVDINRIFRGETLSLGIRSTFGFSNARTQRPEIYNTSFALLVGIVF